MEQEEQHHIIDNLPDLLETMRVNSLLLANLRRMKIIGSNDEAEVNSKTSSMDKCYCLVQILQTRRGGYEGLIEALKNSRQNGAIEILQRFKSNDFYNNPIPPQFHQDREKLLRCDEVPALQLKWEHFIQERKEIFMNTRASDESISELINEFYSQELNELIKNKKVGLNVLEEIHKQIYESMMKGFLKVASHVPKFYENQVKISDILIRNFHIKEKNFLISLNGNQNFTEPPAIGIDLGTCNCCVAVCLNGKVKIFLNNSGDKTTPSFVAYHEAEPEEVGKTARKNAFRNSKYTIYDAKRIIGRDFHDPDLQADRRKWPFSVVEDNGMPKIVTPNKTVSAVDISARLLQECVQQAEADLQQKITKAVITVPAYFNDGQIKATKEAGDKAGLTVLKILKEPTAAAIMYRQERNYQYAKRVLIFDMGGGTFDVAVADISDDEIDIIGIDGDTHLGGEDFDQKIVEYCIQSFKRSTGNDLRTWKSEANNRRNLSALKLECEEAKKDLSTSTSVKICIAQDEDNLVTLTREKFEEISMDLFEKMLSIVERLLKDTEVGRREIEDVILVGGSTRIPKLKELLSNYFYGKALNHNANQDYAVAYGAAIVAATINGEEVRKLLNLKNIKDVIPMSIGIQCIKDGEPGRFSRIIEKNSKYPNVYKEMYTTFKDNQEAATIRVYQGERENVAENFFIGSFRFEGIPKAPRGMEEIEVCMEVDNMGILNVTANCRGFYGSEALTVHLDNNRNRQRNNSTESTGAPTMFGIYRNRYPTT